MHIELLWLGIILLPLAAWVAWRSRGLEPAGRWLLRAATILLCLAAMGVHVRCDREMRIVAMVDVSPSTRSAAFRDPVAVEAKLRQLVPNRSVEIRYFADGRVVTSTESSATRTRLPETDADAVILMSDGRFEAPGAFPPVYPLIDPSLDRATDAHVADITAAPGVSWIASDSPGSDRVLQITGLAQAIPLQAGPSTITAAASLSPVTATIAPTDAWPENNSMSAIIPPPENEKPWIITDASQLPTDAAAYLAPPTVVISASVEVSALQAERLGQYVRDLGGSLVIVGSPRDVTPDLRPLSPLTGVPPEPEAQWMILLDASGSMATGAKGDSRWDRSLAAAVDAVQRLEAQQRVSIAVFSRSPEPIADSIPPAEAIARLRSLSTRPPSGPTGLESALRSVAARPSASPTRLLLVTDADATLGSPEELIRQLSAAKVSVFVLATGSVAPDAALRGVATRTGGALVEQADSNQWSQAMRTLVDAASGDDVVPNAPIATSGTLAGVALEASKIYRAFPRKDVESLARSDARPLAATWQIGLGRVTGIAAELPRQTIDRVADRLKRSPSDPRFSVAWGRDAVVVTASDKTRALNGLPLVLVDALARVPLVQTAPGRYEAAVDRSNQPRMVRIVMQDSLVATRAVPGCYPPEFDRIGNDRDSLEALAARTGGSVVEASGASAIDLPRATELRPATPMLATFGLLTLGAAIVFIRAPYLADRLARYARRSVR